jgi:hypothetical protein
VPQPREGEPTIYVLNPGLERSRVVRAGRRRVKQRLRAPGQRAASWRLAAELIERPSQVVLGMRVSDLLLAAACTGPDAVDWLLDFAGLQGETKIPGRVLEDLVAAHG